MNARQKKVLEQRVLKELFTLLEEGNPAYLLGLSRGDCLSQE